MTKKTELRVFPSPEARTKFKMLCAQLGTSMSQRLVRFIEHDVETWEKTGTPLEIPEKQDD